MRIASVGRALPRNYYDQDTLTKWLGEIWSSRHHNVSRLESLHRNVLVGGRHLAVRIEDYAKLNSFTATNDAFIANAVELGEAASRDALKRAGVAASDVDHIFFVSVTGIATPSIDARLVSRLGLRSDVKRTPIFGLGCVAGAAGIARASDYVRAYPNGVALLVSVELCSMTLQQEDLSVANIIATGLFGDGAAAAVVVGHDYPSQNEGPKVRATRSIFYPNTERVMGWDITSEGFRIVLSADVPKIVEKHMVHDVGSFLRDHNLHQSDIRTYVCHPGGPKVIEAFETSLGLDAHALAVTKKSLATLGNLSSASVLMVLRETMAEHKPEPGSYGLLMAMGPGFCSELVLLQW